MPVYQDAVCLLTLLFACLIFESTYIIVYVIKNRHSTPNLELFGTFVVRYVVVPLVSYQTVELTPEDVRRPPVCLREETKLLPKIVI